MHYSTVHYDTIKVHAQAQAQVQAFPKHGREKGTHTLKRDSCSKRGTRVLATKSDPRFPKHGKEKGTHTLKRDSCSKRGTRILAKKSDPLRMGVTGLYGGEERGQLSGV